MVERKTYGGPVDPRHAKMLDASFEATAQRTPTSREVAQARTIEDKIARLRERLKQVPVSNRDVRELRAVLFGFLDLLGDEL